MTLPRQIREAPLTKAADHTNDVVVVTDASGRTMWASDGFDRLASQPLRDCATPLAHAPGANGDAAAAILRALDTRQAVKTQVEGQKHTGESVWYDLEISPLFDASARLGGYVAIQRDISYCVERGCDLTKAVLSASRAEGRLRAAIEATADGFAIYDENDRLLIANQAFRDMHPGVEHKTAPGVSFEELLRHSASAGLFDLGGEDVERWIEPQLRAARTPSSDLHVKYAQRGWVSRRHKRMENNETVRIWTTIDALKRQQAELEGARTRAEAADRAKSHFLTNMSHEIRTPMNGIIGFNDLLLGSDLSDRQREYATLIQSSARSLMSLIDELLDLGKIERGTLEIEALPFKLFELIAAARALEALAEVKSLSFSIECSVPPDTVAVGDLKRIRQILVNLVGNAIKFTENGAVKLSISQEKEGLSLVVEDTGRGISPERQKVIFERFYQGQEPGSGKVQGSGLGLAIANDLVGLMGGEIGVASEFGGGSAFKVWLPLWLDLEKTPESAPMQALEPANPVSARAYKVLVAEDHPINLKLAMALIQAAGCEAQSAENGQQVLAKLEKSEYDLIVMDSQMPVMTGIEAIKAIRRLPTWKRQTPILSLTADAMKGAEEFHALAGADAYMSKPLRSDAFIEAVKRLSERGRALREKHLAAGALEPV
jgi:two-component system, sensor histidine kinase